MAPWLRCIDRESGRHALHEAHASPIGAHEGARALTWKILRMGLYWSDIHEDATKITRTCAECQAFSLVKGVPPVPLTSIVSPRPFYRWGIESIGPFPEAPGRIKFLVVVVDYFTKWIEPEPLVCITGRQMIKFLWKNIITRYGNPKS